MITRIFGCAALLCAGVLGFGEVSAGAGVKAVANASTGWLMPVAEGKVVRDYLGPIRPYGPGHRGVDLVGPSGGSKRVPVLAPNFGEISFAGWVGLRPVVSIHHDGSLISSFEPACTDLPVGSRVEPWQPIAWVCSGKATYLPHCRLAGCLHWGMRNSSGYFSPMLLLGLLPPSRLLPWRDG